MKHQPRFTNFNHGLIAAGYADQCSHTQLAGSETLVVAAARGTILAKVEGETSVTNEKGQEPMEAIQQIQGEQGPAEFSNEIRLNLIVRDPEVIFELSKHSEGSTREGFALSALRLGVLALRQASGAIDVTTIRGEGERLLGSVRELLLTNSVQTLGGMTTALKQYFDPANGTLPQRLERLLKKDGELEAVLARHLDGDASSVARTLAKHVGEQSPLVKLLSPKQSDGVICALTEVIQAALKGQREIVLRQFSLDDKESALSRLIAELTGANGRLREDLSKDLATVRNEFSLDNEQGALSRLVSRVERAQQTIADQFSKDNENSALCRMSRLMEATSAKVDARLTLDDETSPLSRLRRELLQVLEGFAKSNSQFQSDVRATVEGLKARREEANLSTRHGVEFEDAVGSVLRMEAQRLGDVFAATGKTTGTKPYCKVGDHVIELGPESAAPGARVVCEAKEQKTFDATQALAEIRSARENRKAEAGIFVFSKATAPNGIETLARFGSDILVVWDRDDAGTDVFLKAALSVARALVVREHVASEKSKADFTEIEKAVARIAKNAEALTSASWWQARSPSTRLGRTVADYLHHLRLILEHANSLMFIDPHLNPRDAKYRDFGVLLQAVRRAPPVPIVEIHRVSSRGSGPNRQPIPIPELEAAFRVPLGPLIATTGVPVEVFIWDDFHDRHLITDIVGVSLANGFDVTTRPGAVTTWNRLGRPDRDDIQREFDPAARRHSLVHRFRVP